MFQKHAKKNLKLKIEKKKKIIKSKLRPFQKNKRSQKKNPITFNINDNDGMYQVDGFLFYEKIKQKYRRKKK